MKNRNAFRTISGMEFTHCRASLSMKINKIEEILDVYVVKNNKFSYDLLLGLDAIKKFKLIQDENLKIYQKIEKTKKGELRNKDKNIREESQVNKIEPKQIKMPTNILSHLSVKEENSLTYLINKYTYLYK